MSLINEIARIEEDTFNDAWSKASLEDTFKYDHNHLMVVYEDGSFGDDFAFLGSQKMVGYIVYSLVMGEAELLRIAVDRDYRGQGFGKKLMEEFITALQFNNADKVTLEVRSQNERAIGLYTIYGFEKIAVRPDYYLEPDDDAVIMQRPIAKNDDEINFDL